jgi:hypothetical protein
MNQGHSQAAPERDAQAAPDTRADPDTHAESRFSTAALGSPLQNAK